MHRFDAFEAELDSFILQTDRIVRRIQVRERNYKANGIGHYPK